MQRCNLIEEQICGPKMPIFLGLRCPG